mgnify:CR=1 FL=1
MLILFNYLKIKYFIKILGSRVGFLCVDKSVLDVYNLSELKMQICHS